MGKINKRKYFNCHVIFVSENNIYIQYIYINYIYIYNIYVQTIHFFSKTALPEILEIEFSTYIKVKEVFKFFQQLSIIREICLVNFNSNKKLE